MLANGSLIPQAHSRAEGQSSAPHLQESRVGRAARALAAERRAVVALEFAVSGVVLLGMVLFVAALSLRLYAQSALDYATSRAARLLAVDNTQSRSGSVGQFRTVSFCPLLAPFLSCNNVTISLTPVTDYLHGSPTGSGPPPFNPGQDESLMLLTAAYTMPALGWPLPGGDSGHFAGNTVTSSYPYQNEY